ncbi:MAG: hypothetical protein KatS3mg110_2828 [Pirellulaceae bacterium]|nr:MAG: hypothetical protein KatS3mg110_2828 [Pirellulaceae bacterium]
MWGLFRKRRKEARNTRRRLTVESLESRLVMSCPAQVVSPELTAHEVCRLLERAAAASASEDAIIAVVDRNGRILGVRAEDDVLATYKVGAVDERTADFVFAIDGAVAKARTAAFFANDTAPITSRTIRFISQSTITQREVESNPNIPDPSSPLRGPGLVAPVGLGGHFPPDVLHTPVVDLFGIEQTNRDSLLHPGADGIKGTADDIVLSTRFNIDPAFVPAGKELFAPESYGFQSKILVTAQSRGIATLPGGIPLYKNGRLVGGIGVFFPGPDGFATFEQGFVANVGQTAYARTNAARVLESEWIAFAAAGGSSAAQAKVDAINGVPALAGFDLPFGRIDLVGVTLEIFGPHPTRSNRLSGVQTLLKVGQSVGVGDPASGADQFVDPGPDGDPATLADNIFYLSGLPVPDGWLVMPHGSGSLTAADVERIINQAIAEADRVRAQIRLQPNGRPGARTRMVFAVTDLDGNVLGLYRMPDATVFSIDVAVAKARNMAYYSDPAQIVSFDRVDDNKDSVPDVSVPIAAALTSRTFRFLAAPRYPSGVEGSLPGAFSSLRDPGINPSTAENLGAPLPASTYSSTTTSALMFNSFNVMRNFRQPTNLQNQNGVVFFPGATPIYKSTILVGGFGVSGDGVDQDDVVTKSGAAGFLPPPSLRADRFSVRGVRLPFFKFPRNPRG